MDTKDTHGHSMWCGMCGGRYGAVHIIVRILLVIFVFWAGVQFGELKGMLRHGYGPMGSYGGGNMMYRTGPMMGGWAASSTPAQ